MILDEDEIPETGNAVLDEAEVQGHFQFDHVNLAICKINLLLRI